MASLLSLAAVACGVLRTRSATGDKLSLHSFLGVPFGTSLREAQHLHPGGTVESSPLGFSCYRVSGLATSEARYPVVIYEFDPRRGMQIVLAEFSPRSTKSLTARLPHLLGKPSRTTRDADGEIQTASWAYANGGEVHFYSARRLLIIQNLPGARYAEDIRLRLQNKPALD